LIYARGYGCADIASNTPVKPDSLMRAASISKAFTAAGVMLLYQQGKLSLDAKVFGPGGILSDFQPLPGKTLNPDLLAVTVRHLLQHSGGWDRSTTQHFNGVPYGEPVDGLIEAAPAALGNPQPGTDSDVIRVMLSQPIQHAPGTYFAYSNFGYVLLGSVIEKVTGTGYEQYIQQNVLKPLGNGRQKLGASLMSDTVNGEVTYYDYPNAPLVPSVFPQMTAPVPRQYGGKLLEAVNSAGEWVVNAVDLCRFLDGLDGRRQATPALLSPTTLQQMLANPNLPNETGSYYGLGFLVTQFATGPRWAKGGDLVGTATNMVHAPTGFTYGLLFNGNPSYDPNSDDSGSFEGGVGGQILTAVNGLAASAIPTGDQYANFPSTLLTPTITAVGQATPSQPSIVSGSWVTITGQNLATATRTWWDREFNGPNLPTEIDHVLVTIDGKPAFMYYVQPTQINVQAPADTATGSVAVQVIRDGTASAPFQVTLASAAPGLFTYSANGKQYAAAIHTNGAVIGDIAGTLPAKAGEIVQLYATGLGSSTPGIILNAPAAMATVPTVTIGGANAAVSYAGVISPGLFQINVTIPQVSSGAQPISLAYGGRTSAAGAVIAIGN
jgi:N-acyl-D-amino-acid deacylase